MIKCDRFVLMSKNHELSEFTEPFKAFKAILTINKIIIILWISTTIDGLNLT